MRITIWLVAILFGVVGASSAIAETISLHQGKTDPATEGWTFNPLLTNGASAGPVGPVGPGEAENATEFAWKIDDRGADTRPVYESARPSPGQVADLVAYGWEYTVRMSSPLSSSTANTRGFQFVTPGPSTLGTSAKVYRVYVTTDANLNQTVRSYHVNGTLNATPTAISPGFHTYRLLGVPAGGGSFNVSLFIDNAITPAISNVTGFGKDVVAATLTPADASFASFGSYNPGASGTMYVSHASLVIIPEPATSSLVCVGLAAFIFQVRRRISPTRWDPRRSIARVLPRGDYSAN